MSWLSKGLKSVFGGGGDPSGGMDAKVMETLDRIVQNTEDVPLPILGPMDLEALKYQGDFNPEQLGDPRLLGEHSQGNTKLEGLEYDPRLMEKQESVIQALENIHASGGLESQDKARLDSVLDSVATQAKGRRGAIQQNMQSRGVGGSGMELLAQLQNSQAATDRASDQGLDIAGQANMRALDALVNSGNIAQTLANDKLGLETAKATAQDSINRFNTQTSINRDLYNTGAMNDQARYNNELNNRFGAANHDNRQSYADNAVNTRNQNMEYNQFRIPQQNFENRMTKVGQVNNALSAKANQYDRMGTANAASGNSIFDGILGGAMAGAKTGTPEGAIIGGIAGGALGSMNKKKRG